VAGLAALQVLLALLMAARSGRSLQGADAAALTGHQPEDPGIRALSNGASITIKINRRAYSPVLRKADLPADTAVPWWGNRTLHWDFA
jgi:hypothetical protein